MAFKLSMGEYWPGDSLLHRMDPRAKIACSLVLMLSVFFVRTFEQLALSWAVSLVLIMLSRVPVKKVLESLRPVALMLMLLSVCNLLLIRTGTVLVALGPLVITTDGLWGSILFSLRLISGVVAAALLLLTTTPTQLTDAFDALLNPLSRIGLHGHELAMVFSLMLRFIPTLADEAEALIDAQTTRGASLYEGSPIRRIKAVIPIVVALIANGLRHASNLSRALDARCYEGGAARSQWHPLRMQAKDWLAMGLALVYTVALALLS